MAIVVAAPFLQTRWFWGLLVFVLIALVVAFYSARLYQVRTIERAGIRIRIARDFHDEFGHQLSNILFFSRTAAVEKKRLSATGQAALDKIIDNSTALNKEMRQFIWEPDPSKDSLQDLLIELKHFSDDLFDCADTAFQLHGLVPELENIILPLNWRSHILWIFKEGMVYVFKHAQGCDRVVLEAALLSDHFILRLINNGCSFDPTTVATGEGLKKCANGRRRLGGWCFNHTIRPRSSNCV